jgi:outer membrane protein assembly factor BamE (lipoprotein component of BamABCDE complex)
MPFRRTAASLCTVVALAHPACSSRPPPPPESDEFTAGTAMQHEIKVGMDQSAVLQALGPPNIPSTDSQHREVWTYDKIPSDRVDTSRSIGGGLIVFGGGRNSPARSATARTLTLIVYFDEQKKVRDLAYNYSSF